MYEIKYDDLRYSYRRMLDMAHNVMKTAYNPYSHFFVGAAVLTKSGGEIITGSNVENAAYGSTICAERAAILHANALDKREFKAIAVIARGENFDTTEVTGPCGSCRQMIFESAQISETNLDVVLSTTKKDKIIIASIEELLPLAFGPKELGVDVKKYQQRKV